MHYLPDRRKGRESCTWRVRGSALLAQIIIRNATNKENKPNQPYGGACVAHSFFTPITISTVSNQNGRRRRSHHPLRRRHTLLFFFPLLLLFFFLFSFLAQMPPPSVLSSHLSPLHQSGFVSSIFFVLNLKLELVMDLFIHRGCDFLIFSAKSGGSCFEWRIRNGVCSEVLGV